MKQKQKYTFYLNNTSRIVLTDEEEDFDIISNKLSNLMNSKTIQAFGTNTDIIIVNPNKIDAIHVSKFESNYSEYDTCDKISKDKNEIEEKNKIIENDYDDEIEDYEEDDDTYKSDLNKGFNDNSTSDFIDDLVSEKDEDEDDDIEIDDLEEDVKEEETEKE